MIPLKTISSTKIVQLSDSPTPPLTHIQRHTQVSDMQIMNSPNAALREIDILRVSFSQEISKKKFFHSGWHLITRSLIIKRLI